MRGSSRGAFAAGQRALTEALSAGADWTALAEDLFGVSGALDSSASLRRALADPSREAEAKRGLAARLFEGRVGPAALAILQHLVAQRWSEERDLASGTADLAVETVMASAEAAGRMDSLEDELFRFDRVVAGTPNLREAITSHEADRAAKAALVSRLLEGKVGAESLRLARQAVLAPRGLRFDRVIAHYLSIAASRREQLTATVTAATPLSEPQRRRLTQALTGIYDKPIQVNVIIDRGVVGGIRVQIGDEVIDGTVLRRLDEARRSMTGT